MSKPTSSKESNGLHSSEDSDETLSSNPTSSKKSYCLISSEDSDETVLNKPITSKGSYTRDALLCGSRNVKANPIIISDENNDEDDQTHPSKRLISMGSRFKQFVTKKKRKFKSKASPGNNPIKIEPGSYLFRRQTIVDDDDVIIIDSGDSKGHPINPYLADTVLDTASGPFHSSANHHTNDAYTSVQTRRPLLGISSIPGPSRFNAVVPKHNNPLIVSKALTSIKPMHLDDIKNITDKKKINAIKHIANIVLDFYSHRKEPLSPLTKDIVKRPAEYYIDFHSKFGYGGFSIVVKAYDHKHGDRPVAVKFASERRGAADSIYNEYVCMKNIEQNGVRNCVRALNYAPKMIVIPYYHWDLFEAVMHYSNRGGFSVKTCLNIIVQVTQCILDLKNNLNLIHNDLKLENIMVSEDLSEACVIDLGMMSLMSEKKFYHGTFTHSYGYRAKSADDLYNVSVGMILFEMLTDGDEVPGLSDAANWPMEWPVFDDLDSYIKGGRDLTEIIRRTLHTNQRKNQYTLEGLDVAL